MPINKFENGKRSIFNIIRNNNNSKNAINKVYEFISNSIIRAARKAEKELPKAKNKKPSETSEFDHQVLLDANKQI